MPDNIEEAVLQVYEQAHEVAQEPEVVVVAKPDVQVATATLRRNYDKVFEDGTLVHLRVSMWSMSSSLSEKDLELEKQPEIIKLGKKMLIPPVIFNNFKRIESKGRAILIRSSFAFPIAEAHFVPNSRLQFVNEELTKIKADFDAYCADFYAKYDEYKEHMLTTYPDLKEKLEGCYPTLASIKEKYSFSWSEFRLAMPKEFGLYDLNAKIAEERVVTEAEKHAQEVLRDKAVKQAAMIEDFVKDAGVLVRQTVLDGCQAIAEKIRRKEVVSKTNIESLMQKVTDFESLNFLNDEAVEARLIQLKEILNGKEDFKRSQASIEKLEVALKSVIDETQKITDVDDLTGKYFRAIDLNDD